MSADDQLVEVSRLRSGEPVEPRSARMSRPRYIYLLERRPSGALTELTRYRGSEVTQPSRTAARAFFTVAGEHCITRAMWRSPAPSSVIRRHCATCSGVRVGGRPSRFPPARAWSRPRPDALAGRVHLVSPLRQHGPAEKLGRGAGVNRFLCKFYHGAGALDAPHGEGDFPPFDLGGLRLGPLRRRAGLQQVAQRFLADI